LLPIDAPSSSSVALRGYIGVSEAARRLGCSPEWVRRLIRMNRLAALSTPYGNVVSIESVRALKVNRSARAAGGVG
jgi:excisionase family DNA binding protein